MAGQTWSITIVTGNPCASFVPDVYSEGPPPTSLQAQLNDLISWNNQTKQEHEIWLTDAEYTPQRALTDEIAPYKSSYPGYVPQQADVIPATNPPTFPQTVYYACSIHPDERGTITLVA